MKKWLAAMFVCSVFAAACAMGAPGARAERGIASDDGTRAALSDMATVGSTKAAATRAVDRGGLVAEKPAPAADRMLIYRGELRVEVARPEDVAREWIAKVKEWGGYLQSQTGTTMTVRLPAPRFDEAFAATRALGRVLDETRQANDVTEEFLDLGIRIDTARKARDRLLDVLKRAEKVEDILKIEAELRRLTEEIERMEGRQKFLGDQVAMATLSLTLQANTQAPAPRPKSRQPNRFHWVNRVGAESMLEGF